VSSTLSAKTIKEKSKLNPRSKSIDHKGVKVELPFIVHEARSVSLYSLLDYKVACKLCEKENFVPVIVIAPNGEKKAAGVISAIEYKKTSLVPYLEWSFGIFVVSNEAIIPEIQFTNETSLFFQSILGDQKIGDSVFCPVLILNETLPTEVGKDHYGYPKVLGNIEYNCDHEKINFIASPIECPWIMKATVPVKRGVLSKFSFLFAMIKAFGISKSIQALAKKEFTVTLLGSAKILAKKAYMKIKNDPSTEMFFWDSNDCKLEINPDSEWGKILIDSKFEPQLICHVPKLKSEFSEPIDQ
jgi:hypothetical protein